MGDSNEAQRSGNLKGTNVPIASHVWEHENFVSLLGWLEMRRTQIAFQVWHVREACKTLNPLIETEAEWPSSASPFSFAWSLGHSESLFSRVLSFFLSDIWLARLHFRVLKSQSQSRDYAAESVRLLIRFRDFWEWLCRRHWCFLEQDVAEDVEVGEEDVE